MADYLKMHLSTGKGLAGGPVIACNNPKARGPATPNLANVACQACLATVTGEDRQAREDA